MVIKKNALVHQKLRPSTRKNWPPAFGPDQQPLCLESLRKDMEGGKRQQLQLPVISPPQIITAKAFVLHGGSLSGINLLGKLPTYRKAEKIVQWISIYPLFRFYNLNFFLCLFYKSILSIQQTILFFGAFQRSCIHQHTSSINISKCLNLSS